jgi:hypothetical protein
MAEPNRDRIDGFIGVAVYGAAITGAGGILFALTSVLAGNWPGAGVGLAASALAFGLLANALLRK